MSSIPDIMDTSKWTVRKSLDERQGKDVVDLYLVDMAARLAPSDRKQGDCHSGTLKIAENTYCTQFYYGNREQFGTGIHEHTDLGNCVLPLLRLQADHVHTGNEQKDS